MSSLKSPDPSTQSSQGEWLRWRIAAAFRMLLWRGSMALENMIYRPFEEVPVEQRISATLPFPEASWHWEQDQGYVLVDKGHKAVDVMPMHPLSEN